MVARRRLDWLSESDTRGQRQTAYSILVASTPEGSRAIRRISGTRASGVRNQTSQLEYNGKREPAAARLVESARLDKGRRSHNWSESASWERGLPQRLAAEVASRRPHRPRVSRARNGFGFPRGSHRQRPAAERATRKSSTVICVASDRWSHAASVETTFELLARPPGADDGIPSGNQIHCGPVRLAAGGGRRDPLRCQSAAESPRSQEALSLQLVGTSSLSKRALSTKRAAAGSTAAVVFELARFDRTPPCPCPRDRPVRARAFQAYSLPKCDTPSAVVRAFPIEEPIGRGRATSIPMD